MEVERDDQWAKCQTTKSSTSAVILSHPLPVKGVSEESVLLFYGQTAVTLIPEGYTVMIPVSLLAIYYAAEQILHWRSTAVPLVQDDSGG